LEAGEKTCKKWMSGNQDKSFLFSNCMRYNAVTDEWAFFMTITPHGWSDPRSDLFLPGQTLQILLHPIFLTGWKLSAETLLHHLLHVCLCVLHTDALKQTYRQIHRQIETDG
jgi:hypothetical protein